MGGATSTAVASGGASWGGGPAAGAGAMVAGARAGNGEREAGENRALLTCSIRAFFALKKKKSTPLVGARPPAHSLRSGAPPPPSLSLLFL